MWILAKLVLVHNIINIPIYSEFHDNGYNCFPQSYQKTSYKVINKQTSEHWNKITNKQSYKHGRPKITLLGQDNNMYANDVGCLIVPLTQSFF